MRIDLHCHSTCSDGDLAPVDVAEAAAARGVELFCLTDHDTLAGYAATVEPLRGRRVLRGLELSCRAYDRPIHVLLYGVQEGSGMRELDATLAEVAEVRRGRLRTICERLAALGHTLDLDMLLARAGNRTAGRPDVARALVEAGVVTSIREAFTRFLRDGGPADVPVTRLSVADGLRLARQCDARAALAHPHTLDPTLVRDLFVRHRALGLEGIEAFYGRYGPTQRLVWLRLAQEQELVATGGSDFHGAILPEVSRPGIDLTESRAEALCAWLGL